MLRSARVDLSAPSTRPRSSFGEVTPIQKQDGSLCQQGAALNVALLQRCAPHRST